MQAGAVFGQLSTKPINFKKHKMKTKRTKMTPLWVVQSELEGAVMYWHEGKDSLKKPDLYPDPTFYPSRVAADLAYCNCVEVYGVEGVTVKSGEIAL